MNGVLDRFKTIKSDDRIKMNQLDVNTGDLFGFYVFEKTRVGNNDWFVVGEAASPIINRDKWIPGKYRGSIFKIRSELDYDKNFYFLHTNGSPLRLLSYDDMPHEVFWRPIVQDWNCLIERNSNSSITAYIGGKNIIEGLRQAPRFDACASWFEDEVRRLENLKVK
ncbi:MAG: hypothetical protein AABW50_02580 [Nanoarchaeota archaeon]